MRPAPRSAPIERASTADLVMRAMEARSRVPQHVGAVLLLGPGEAGPAELARILGTRAAGIPRLRQRLVTVPPGFGRPVWLDVPRFDAGAHVRLVPCPPPGDEPALLGLAAGLVGERLPTDRPLWVAAVVPGLAGGRTGVVLVVHHVVADGLGGLAVLTGLLDPRPGDGGPAEPAPPDPLTRPGWGRLAADALRADRTRLERLPAAWRDLRRSLRAGGGLRAEPAARCSLLVRTSGGTRLAVARTDLGALRLAAHRHGATVNDAVLAAAGGALATVLEKRGETVDTFRVAVMVSARRAASPDELGNQVTPLLVDVPAGGPPDDRVRQVAGRVARARDQATGPSVVTVLGPAFRWAARAGIYRLVMRHQHRMHTLVSSVRGPVEPATLGGLPLSVITPVAVGESGNIALSFVVLTYAGTLTVTMVGDSSVADLPVLAGALQGELDALAGSARAHPPAG